MTSFVRLPAAFLKPSPFLAVFVKCHDPDVADPLDVRDFDGRAQWDHQQRGSHCWAAESPVHTHH